MHEGSILTLQYSSVDRCQVLKDKIPAKIYTQSIITIQIREIINQQHSNALMRDVSVTSHCYYQYCDVVLNIVDNKHWLSSYTLAHSTCISDSLWASPISGGTEGRS